MPEKNAIYRLWKRFLPSVIRSGILFGVLGVISYLSGIPFVWPSLGPTAYILAFDKDKNHPFKKVFGAHTLGALSGLAAHLIFAPKLTIAVINQPLASAGLKIALSAVFALSLTTGLMRATRWTHSPACATTLIVGLGLISGPKGVLFLLVAITIVYGAHFINEILFKKLGW